MRVFSEMNRSKKVKGPHRKYMHFVKSNVFLRTQKRPQAENVTKKCIPLCVWAAISCCSARVSRCLMRGHVMKSYWIDPPCACAHRPARSNSIISQRICRTNFEKWSFIRSAPLKKTTIVGVLLSNCGKTQCVGSGSGATFLYLVPRALGCFPGRAFYFLRSRPFFLALVRRKQLASIRIKYHAHALSRLPFFAK